MLMRFLFGDVMSGKWEGMFSLCDFLSVTSSKTRHSEVSGAFHIEHSLGVELKFTRNRVLTEAIVKRMLMGLSE